MQNGLPTAENAVEMINDSFSNKDLETLKELPQLPKQRSDDEELFEE